LAQLRQGRRERDAPLQAGHGAQRTWRQGRQGEVAQAGNRDRPVEGAQEGKEGPEEEGAILRSGLRGHALSWANVHCCGALSGRQRNNLVPWRKRCPVTWSKRTSTTSAGCSGSQAALRSVLQRLGPPGAFPVKPGAWRNASSLRVRSARSLSAIVDVKPTWSSLPSSS